MQPALNSLEFLSDFRRGGQISFRMFFDATSKRLKYNIIAKFPFQSEVEIEDYIAEAYTRVYHKRNEYQCFDHICASLYVVAERLCIDDVRRKAMAKTFFKKLSFFVEKYDIFRTALEQEPDPVDLIEKTLPKLAKKERMVFELSYYGKKSIGEISIIMGTDLQTIRNQRSDAINNIRKHLGITSDKIRTCLHMSTTMKAQRKIDSYARY